MKISIRDISLFAGILFLVYPSVNGCGRGSMYIENNEYHNMLIAVSETVAEDEALITRIKEVFTEASEFLYRATRKRAFFKTVTILVPRQWTGIDIDNVAVNETHDKSDIVIDHPEPGQDDTPFTVKTTPCGELGYYTHLTPNYLRDETVAARYGPYDKTIVHEFAHLRYGVYDEFPSEDGGQHFYPLADGTYTGTRCSASIPGSLYNPFEGRECQTIAGVPEQNCRWIDRETDVVGNYSSLMYRQYLDFIVEFCDNETGPVLHNRNAPTQQNIQCFGKSIWQVMREHPDFRDGNNSPRTVEDTSPEFRIVRQQEKRTVLVLDTSGSMDDERKIEILGQACSSYISHIIRDGESLGIVWFDTNSEIREYLIEITTDSREELLKSVPTKTGGNTAIGSGILDGLKVLAGSSKEMGGTLIVVSDGEENRAPYVADIVADVLDAQVIVHSIAITNAAASSVDELATITGGLSFYVCTNPSCNNNAINDAFQTIAELNISPDQQKFTLNSFAVSVFGGKTESFSIIVDGTLGTNTEFVLDYERSGIKFEIIAPNGKVFTEESEEVVNDDAVFTSRLTFMEASGVGTWTYNITNGDRADQRVAVSITSMSATPGEYPIIAQAFWGERSVDLNGNYGEQVVYASVSKGYAPVLKAEVIADIEKPDNNVASITLLDNGAGADRISNDGVYSAYFLDFVDNGRYGLSVRVENAEGTVISTNRVIGSSAAGPPGESSSTPDSPTGGFVRQAAGGSFELIGYSPGTKLYEPGRVTDLKVTEVDYGSLLVTLSWISVGEELTSGTASGYELRYGTDIESMYDDFTNQDMVTDDMVESGNLTAPQPPGLQETLVLQVPTGGNISYVFGLRVWDYEGRIAAGPVSNIAVASLTPFPGGDSSEGVNVALIVGLTVGIIGFLVLVVVVGMFLEHRYHFTNKITSKDSTKNGNQSGQVNNAYTV